MKKAVAFATCILTVLSLSVNGFAAETIRRGARGEDVREIQEMLIAKGYLEEGGADGVFGAKTEQAVLAFQQENALDATGIVGEATDKALKADTAEQETEAAGTEEAATTEEEAAGTEEAATTEEETAGTEEAEETTLDLAETFPSWNSDSASLQELVAFVSASTDESGDGYLEPEDRIATFDMDGTILCEKAPVYFDYCLTMYRVLDDPAYAATEEERDAMQQVRDVAYSEGKTFKPEGLNKDIMVATAFAGMTPAEFRAYVVDYAAKAEAVGFEGMKYIESFYKPMLEVISYLKANDFDVWMVSACELIMLRLEPEGKEI